MARNRIARIVPAAGRLMILAHVRTGLRLAAPHLAPLERRVTESGGPLSHGAVTVREVGIPAVMAVRGVLSRLTTGVRIRVNGTSGGVRVVED